MSVPVRILGFGAALAAVFVLAVVAGGIADLGESRASAERSAGHGKDAGGGMKAMSEDGHAGKANGHASEAGGHGDTADPVRGLAVTEHGLTLELERTTATPGEATELAFRIRDARGRTVRDFDIEHAKRMHLILARRDLGGFQHLHPRQRADGSWTVTATLPEPGSYRVFADFASDGDPVTLGADLSVDGTAQTRPLPAPSTSTRVDGLDVRLRAAPSRAGAESELGFTVTRDGKPVPVEPYLGARGHLVALREGDLAFLHVHPDEDSLRFAASFPSAARYRLYLQFKVDGRVHTAEFTREVER